ncbi:hypothetical protein AB0D14_40855 [Streptomyces sp. NPDC048484]|uniref:calcium-binding protein n=1 Tax=Streptomyces sp. NPDC048484 TaxID=3155146 RepID=UPI003445885F
MAAAVGATMALSAGQAQAATGVIVNSAIIDITAAAGKTNHITISGSGSEVTIADTGDTVTAGSGCTQVTSGVVRCPAGTRQVFVSAKDGNDTVTLSANLRAGFNGGDGNDTLAATAAVTERVVLGGDAGDDTLRGGSGGDFLIGASGRDTGEGNAGNDTLGFNDEVGANDSANGGPGTDNCVVDVGDTRVSCEP